jgi:hypothetical protein
VLSRNDIKEVGGSFALYRFIMMNASARRVLKDRSFDLKNLQAISISLDDLLDLTRGLPVLLVKLRITRR